MKPVAGSLLEPLKNSFRQKDASPERRELCATILADYAAERPEVLADLLLDADSKQYALLFPLVKRHRDQAVERFKCTIKGEEFWNEGPLDAKWQKVPEVVVGEIESAEGLLGERWALCQTLPLERWGTISEELRKCGYRPLRFRPWVREGTTHVAAVWTRDGQEFVAEIDLSADTIKKRDAFHQNRGFLPADVAGYDTGAKTGFTALWVKSARQGEEARLYVDIADAEHKATTDALRNQGFIALTLHSSLGAEGARHCGIWWKARQAPKVWNVTWNNSEDVHKGRVLLAEHVMVDVSVRAAEVSSRKRLELAATQFMQADPLGLAVLTRVSYLPPPLAFGSVWHSDPKRESEQTHGLTVTANLTRCRELAYQGYRPVAICVTTLDGTTHTASAWHRPFPERQEDRERLARRQATAAASLLKLEVSGDVWSMYRHRRDPEARSQLLWRGGLLDVDPIYLVKRLDEETDVSAKRALILALGEFSEQTLPISVRNVLVPKLLAWYRDDPDPGLHGAIDWLLRHGKEGPKPRLLDWGQTDKLREIDESLKRRDPDGKRRWYVNGQGQTMVLIPGPVEFRSGSPSYDPDRIEGTETPHRRRIPRSFAIGAKSVTTEEFKRYDPMHNFNARYSPGTDGPIISVTWFQAAQYCNWLSEREGIPQGEWCYPRDIKEGMRPFPDYLRRNGYRLPSEAELEYAARAGTITSRSYGFSDELLTRYAWFHQNAGNRAWSVGQLRCNDLGLFDIHGNVWNWGFERSFLHAKPTGTNGIVDKEDEVTVEDQYIRALRGGSFIDLSPSVRSPNRGSSRPSNRFNNYGLRVARTCNS